MKPRTSLLTFTLAVLTLLAACIATFLWFVVVPIPGTASGVNTSGIQRIRMGMNPRQVESILGRPFTIESYKGSRTHRIGCRNSGEAERTVNVTADTNINEFFKQVSADTAVHACDVDDERKHDRNSTFIYTRRGGLVWTYPMVWVHFDNQSSVSSVYIKEYAPEHDDMVIYLLSDGGYNVNNQGAMNRLLGNEQ